MQYIEYETSSSRDNPEQLLFYKSRHSFRVSDEICPEYYIGFGFKKHVFSINSFSISSSFNPTNSKEHPKTWKIIGLMDDVNWIVLNSHINDNTLNGFNLFAYIKTEEIVVRYLRFVSPTPFALYSLEFFGNLYPSSFIFPLPYMKFFQRMMPCFGQISAINLV